MSPLLRDRAADRGPTTSTDPAPDGPADGSTAVVEASTAADAIAEVQRLHGRSARILRAEKVLRGGLGGFFARELVRLTVDLGTPAGPPPSVSVVPPPVARDATSTAPGPGPDRANPIVAALAAGVDDGPPGETFGELLDRRAAEQGVARAPVVPAGDPGRARPAGRATQGTVDHGTSGGTGGAASPSSGVARVVDELARQTGTREESAGEALRAAIVVERLASRGDGASDPAEPEEQPSRVEAAGRRGAASLLDRPPGAARLVAHAERVVRPTTPTVAPSPSPSPSGSEGTGAPAGTSSDGAARLALDDLLPSAGRSRPTPRPDAGARSSGSSVLTAVAPPDDEAARAGAAGDDTIVEVVGGTADEVCARAGATDPLPVRHEAMRQLRACARLLEAGPLPRRAERAPAPGSTSSAPAPAARATTSPHVAVATSGWSGERLALAGLPSALVEQVVEARPGDDIGWFVALARALEPLCPTLAPAAEVVVGPAARAFSTPLAAPVVGPDGRAAPRGSCTLATERTSDARRWLAEERAGRPLHLVVGDGDWRGWLFDAPDVVSWTSEHHLADALDVACRAGASLGWSLVDGLPRRATPLDVAVSLRTRLADR